MAIGAVAGSRALADQVRPISARLTVMFGWMRGRRNKPGRRAAGSDFVEIIAWGLRFLSTLLLSKGLRLALLSA
jgi:hypothetical protein